LVRFVVFAAEDAAKFVRDGRGEQGSVAEDGQCHLVASPQLRSGRGVDRDDVVHGGSPDSVASSGHRLSRYALTSTALSGSNVHRRDGGGPDAVPHSGQQLGRTVIVTPWERMDRLLIRIIGNEKPLRM
jgi:hypothetical protein